MSESAAARVNILLVYPETPRDSYWSFSNSLEMIGKKASMPPLGLVTVAGMLPADAFSCRLVDMNIRELSDADMEWADVVFVSAMIVQKDSLEATLARLRPFGKPVVAGGPYTSTAYRETENVDCFLIGEAEGVWEPFLADLRAGTLRAAYAAPVRREEREALSAFFGDAALILPAAGHPDIDLAPLPRFDLLDLDAYAVMPVQASRGCPVGCEFCDIWRRFGRASRNKAPARILAELDELHRLGWRDAVFVVDDNFIGNRARATELLRAMREWQRRRGRPFSFLTEATLSLADDDDMLSLMAETGFSSVFFGIETPCEESLRETRKHINTLGNMADKVAKIQAAGIEPMSGFIIGFDADPEDIADKMTACIQEMGIPQAMIGLLNALPDTDLHDRLEREGRIRFRTTGNNTHGFAMNFVPARDEGAVLADYKKVLETAYPRNMKKYFERCAVLRRRWPRAGTGHGSALPFGWKARALANCLGAALRSGYRFGALRFLIGTLFLKPSFFEQAVTLCAKGHHFWIITGHAFAAEEMREFMVGRLRELADFLRGKRAAVGEALGQDVSAFMTEALAEIESYRKYVLKETETKFLRLSRDTRRLLESELERFRLETGALCREYLASAFPAALQPETR